MAKIIRLTQEHINKCCEEVQAQADKRLPNGTVEFKKVFEVKDRKATVYFTSKAWLKMELLVLSFEKEVGWYGVASRLGDEEKDMYLISDIIVYPQEVTAATVDMAEPEEMAKWRMENIDDERLDHIYMHGHSHVRMGTSPSGTDLEHQREILDQMADDGFYIFMIYNKRLEHYACVYDMKKNVQFENKDVSIGFYDEDEKYHAFLSEAKDLVKDRVYVYHPKTQAATPTTTPTTPTPTTPAATTPVYKTPTHKDHPAEEDKPASAPSVPAKNASSTPVQGMGWRGRDNYRGFYNYNDDTDEYYDPEFGWIPGDTYRKYFYEHGYYD